jgi:HlyD family secretion protein
MRSALTGLGSFRACHGGLASFILQDGAQHAGDALVRPPTVVLGFGDLCMPTDKGGDAGGEPVPKVAGSPGVAKPASVADTPGATELPPSELPPSGLPAVVPPSALVAPSAGPPPAAAAQPSWRRWIRPGLLLLVLLLAAVGGGYWWLHPRAGLPPGIASGNGRLEADEIDIDTKFAGRIATLFADEGDLTKAGEVLAKMDTQDLQASLQQDQALTLQAGQTLEAAKQTLEQQKSQVVYAKQEIARTQSLVGQGFATHEELDQRTQALASAVAGEHAAADAIAGAQNALDAAKHAAEVFQVNIADDSLVSPRDGRIEYRVANVGEVLPAGGKVFTMLDTGYIYMDIYLPTLEAGRVKLGSDARIVLDAYPAHPFPAKVVFLAAQAQFTPKTVETKDERDVLMFRVRVRIDPEQLAAHAAAVRSGLPGMAYVETASNVVWPANLQGARPK